MHAWVTWIVLLIPSELIQFGALTLLLIASGTEDLWSPCVLLCYCDSMEKNGRVPHRRSPPGGHCPRDRGVFWGSTTPRPHSKCETPTGTSRHVCLHERPCAQEAQARLCRVCLWVASWASPLTRTPLVIQPPWGRVKIWASAEF